MSEDKNKRKVLSTSLRIVAQRDHSTAEIKQKLIRKGFSPDLVDYAVNELLRLEYLNDEEFAR